jgi:hypothetical protein
LDVVLNAKPVAALAEFWPCPIRWARPVPGSPMARYQRRVTWSSKSSCHFDRKMDGLTDAAQVRMLPSYPLLLPQTLPARWRQPLPFL